MNFDFKNELSETLFLLAIAQSAEGYMSALHQWAEKTATTSPYSKDFLEMAAIFDDMSLEEYRPKYTAEEVEIDGKRFTMFEFAPVAYHDGQLCTLADIPNFNYNASKKVQPIDFAEFNNAIRTSARPSLRNFALDGQRVLPAYIELGERLNKSYKKALADGINQILNIRYTDAITTDVTRIHQQYASVPMSDRFNVMMQELIGPMVPKVDPKIGPQFNLGEDNKGEAEWIAIVQTALQQLKENDYEGVPFTYSSVCFNDLASVRLIIKLNDAKIDLMLNNRTINIWAGDTLGLNHIASVRIKSSYHQDFDVSTHPEHSETIRFGQSPLNKLLMNYNVLSVYFHEFSEAFGLDDSNGAFTVIAPWRERIASSDLPLQQIRIFDEEALSNINEIIQLSQPLTENKFDYIQKTVFSKLVLESSHYIKKTLPEVLDMFEECKPSNVSISDLYTSAIDQFHVNKSLDDLERKALEGIYADAFMPRISAKISDELSDMLGFTAADDTLVPEPQTKNSMSL